MPVTILRPGYNRFSHISCGHPEALMGWRPGAGQLFQLGSSRPVSNLTLEAQHCI